MFDILAACLVITALFSWLNHRFVGLPTTIGVMVIALGVSLSLVALDASSWINAARVYEERLLRSIDFSTVLMQGMLSLLLFAGALHVDLRSLRSQRWSVATLAIVGTVASTLVVGFGMWLTLTGVGLPLDLIYCLLFGALISPTDPIAVMGIVRAAGAPHKVELLIAGESLFNDGVGVVVFAILLGMLTSGDVPSWQAALGLLVREAGGGLAFGAVLGFVAYWLLKSIDQYQVEVLVTLATVTGGYAMANHLHVSGPLAMVVAGLVVGNQGRARAMSDTTRRYVDMFWELIDEILNAVLFVLIGMEVLLIATSPALVVGGIIAVLMTLLARTLCVGIPVRVAQARFDLPTGAWKVVTWGGLRGGISVALALSLPAGPEREAVVALTYSVVVVSILAQGLTIGPLVRRTFPRQNR